MEDTIETTNPSYKGEFKIALEFDRRCRNLESTFNEISERIEIVEKEISHFYDSPGIM